MAYSDIEVTEAMVKLAVNKGDYDKTAKDTGVSERTLKRWAKMAPKKGVPELLERAIERMLMVIPSNMSGHDWAIALGILMDKWLLIQGEPTERKENIISDFKTLSEDERRAIVDDAKRIISGLSVVGSNGSKK